MRKERPSATSVTAVAISYIEHRRRRGGRWGVRTDGVYGEAAGPGGGDGHGALAVGVVEDGGVPAVIGIADAVAILLVPARCPVFFLRSMRV